LGGLKRGYYVLIAGAALFVAGIIVTIAWAVPLAAQFERETTFLQGTPLEAGQSKELTLEVTDISRPLSVLVNSLDPDAQLQAVLVTPEGSTAIDSIFTENTVLSADPAVQGTYRMTVANVGQSPTSVDVIFGRLPGVEANNQVNIDAFGGILAGAGITIAGVLVMIAGVIILIIDRRKRVAS
jgi:hypothetical protein